jgi:Immunity protein Imm1
VTDSGATVRWRESAGRQVATEGELLAALADAEAEATNPIVVTVEAPAGTLTLVVGDPAGSSLVYFPQDYAETGLGSLSSVGDPAGQESDAWEPPQTAFNAGHHSELPRWMVVPNDAAREALREFFATGGELPTSIAWVPD